VGSVSLEEGSWAFFLEHRLGASQHAGPAAAVEIIGQEAGLGRPAFQPLLHREEGV